MANIQMKPVIIIGAPRSGTNMLRDALTALPNFCTWPCDEINFIWRYGNALQFSDEFPEHFASEKVKAYVRRSFQNIADKYSSQFVVEKTCANSLRVPYVERILPEAKYIFIVRDGIDVTGSAAKRWTASLELSYLISKARFVPARDIPIYASKFLWSRFYRLFSKENRVAIWGPRFDALPNVLKERSLTEVCAIQWQRCIEQSDASLAKIAPEKIIRVKYEDFVTNPTEQLRSIIQFLGHSVDEKTISCIVSDVSNRSLGKGYGSLGEAEVQRLRNLIGDTLSHFGY